MNEPNDAHPLATPAIRLTFGRHVMNYFFTGLIIAGPVGITLYIAWWIIGVVDKPRYALRAQAPSTPARYLPFEVPGFGLIVALLTITIVGFLAANLVGRTLVQLGERLLSRVPMVSTLYKAIKQLFETVLAQSGDSFRQVGLIQYPSQGLWSLVFISTEAKGEIADTIEGDADHELLSADDAESDPGVPAVRAARARSSCST